MDNGIKAWQRKFEHHKKLYDEQAKRFQDLKSKVEPQILSLENQIITLENNLEDLLICPYCSKEYKQRHHFERHLPKCKAEQNKIAEKNAEIRKLKDELATLEALKELDKENNAEIVENTKKGE